MSWFSFQPFLAISSERPLIQKTFCQEMVLQSLCVTSPMEKKATPNGVMAQWRAYSGSSDIQNTVLLTSRCRYHFPATKHSFELTPSSLLRLGDFHVTDFLTICVRSLTGTITRMPQSKHSWYKVISFLRL